MCFDSPLSPVVTQTIEFSGNCALTSRDLGHQNPEINSREELIEDFERIYKRRILMEDVVTVIYFSEVHDELE